MSYTSGINSLQRTISPITPSDAKPAIQANASDQEADRSVEQTANPERVDQTNLSSTGGLVAQALEGSDTRSTKVASLQQAIAAGTYGVSSSDVADKIIQSLLD
jgi:negative regulator of flagellin synthesis FlgM